MQTATNTRNAQKQPKRVTREPKVPPHKPKKEGELHVVDRKWLEAILRDRQISARQLCLRHLHMDPGAFSNRMAGITAFKTRETEIIAEVLQVPHQDVMQHLLAANPLAGSRDFVSVVGAVGAHGFVTMGQSPQQGPRRVEAPVGMPHGAVALRFNTQGTKGDYADGWLAYYVQKDGGGVDVEAIGRLCVVTLAPKTSITEEAIMVRVLRRGYEKGTYTLINMLDESDQMLNVRLKGAVPVLWLRMSA